MKEEVEYGLLAEEVGMIFDGGVEERDKKLVKQMYKMYNDLQRKMKMVEGNKDKMGKEMDKEKLKELISEYKKFKKENVRHFRFHPNASLNVFGKSFLCTYLFKHAILTKLSVQERNCPSPPSSWCRSTLTLQPSTRSRGTRRSRLRPS